MYPRGPPKPPPADGSEVQALPLQSIILQPTQGDRVTAAADGTLAVGGVAYHGAGGSPVKSVEVSVDEGASWHAATLLRGEVLADDAKAPHHWLRWKARVPLGGDGDARERPCTVCCRAIDVEGNAQPKVSQQQRGYLYNGWFAVDLTVAPPSAAGGTQ